MAIMFWYSTSSRIRNPKAHWFCSHRYYFHDIWSNSLNVSIAWENRQYFTRKNQNTRTIKRNVQKRQSTFLLIFLALKLSSLNSYLSRQCISNSQFSRWPAIPKLLTSDYADCAIIVFFFFFEMLLDIPPKAARNYFSNSLKWHTLFHLSLAALQSCPRPYG